MEIIPSVLWIFLPLTVLLCDLGFGDPRTSWHPVCLIGASLRFFERNLRAMGLDGYFGGVLLFLLLSLLWLLPLVLILNWLRFFNLWLAFAFESLLGGLLLAWRSLIGHAWQILKASELTEINKARKATALLVGRDTEKMSAQDCRRAAVESLGESLTDGILAPLFFLALGGLPAMLCFKIISTMDSMVGYKTERYLSFGWAGARLDDILNYLPARLCYFLTSLCAIFLPGFQGISAFKVGYQHHAKLPGPNSGWSETALAGALGIQIAGPIWKNGNLVNTLWVGDSRHSQDCSSNQVKRAIFLVSCVTFGFTGIIALFNFLITW